MIRALICLSVAVTVYGMTTMAPAAPTIFYDMKHHKAMIVKTDGCYEYHMNHDDVMDYADATAKAAMEKRMLEELAMATNIQEMGHNHINHMSPEIVSACTNLPVYSWDLIQITTTTAQVTAI